MKRLLIIPLLLLITSGPAFSQGMYFKLFPGYNFSVSRQQMPDYLTHEVMIPTGTGYGRQSVNLNDPEFSVASGINISAAAGYTINDLLSVELRFSGFANTRKHFEAANTGFINGESEWDYRSLSVMPAIVFGKTVNKTSLNIYAFSGIGAADLEVTTIFGEVTFYEVDGQDRLGELDDTDININPEDNKLNHSHYGLHLGVRYVFGRKGALSPE